jgi:glycosyltransferase involved in cell wall biosynthesis
MKNYAAILGQIIGLSNYQPVCPRDADIVKIAFYAPMKSPHHPIPSGDRRVGRLFMRALEGTGADVTLASEYRSFDKTGDADQQDAIHQAALREADRLIEEYQQLKPSGRPDLWFTYHLYHKAPDWIGPMVCKALKIPYFVAEASHAPKQNKGRWDKGYQSSVAAISNADRVFHMTQLDGACLKQLVEDPNKLVQIPPFIEDGPAAINLPDMSDMLAARGFLENRLTLLSVGMLRGGDKFRSYTELAEALEHLTTDNWQLIIVGDGPNADQIKSLFAPFGNRIIFAGQLSETQLASVYKAADIYVWPAYGEAFGMAFLEAARAGLPVVACAVRGVPDVVKNGETGLLVPASDMQAFATAIDQLAENPDRCSEMGRNGAEFVCEERGLKQASDAISVHIEKVTA